MNSLVRRADNTALVSSKDLADKFGKKHSKVLRDVRDLHCSDEFREANFGLTTYTTVQNKKVVHYEITRDGFAFLCMGWTGPEAGSWKEKYIEAFNSMEKALRSAPSTMASLNEIVKRIEGNKEAASVAGQALASYRKIKKTDTEEFEKAVKQAQLVLDI